MRFKRSTALARRCDRSPRRPLGREETRTREDDAAARESCAESEEMSIVDQVKECRICYSDEESSRLFSPCRCTGTSRYVHDDCLTHWLIVGPESSMIAALPANTHTRKRGDFGIPGTGLGRDSA
ncbi:hypothetical protein L596_023302 [Steinernema carpocapsae]|uniref:RING-CH-type domain-containing protein n=1 Tax=Steinernema carpocapsae TaxID=34508 RepID=A0A4U5MD86_STECR|nr:hypothetical protein L596_023302 [Steinernema carpocapsae]